MSLPWSVAGGTINPPGDIDYYKFPGAAGDEVIVWLRPQAGLVPILSFYDSSGKLLAYNDKEVNLGYAGFPMEPILYLHLPAGGIYYVSVKSAGNIAHDPENGTTGNYSLFVNSRQLWSIPADMYDPHDTRATATPMVLPFDSGMASLVCLGEVNWYRFTAVAGAKFSVDIEALELKAHPDWPMTVQTRIGIFDESGRLLQESSGGADPEDGFVGDPALTFTAPRDGRYYVGVASANDPQYGSLFTNADFLADPYVSSASHSIGFYRIQVRALHDLFFPQVASGSFGSVYFTTSVILINTGDIEAAGSIAFSNSDATPMLITDSPSVKASDRHWFRIPPKGSYMFRSDGSGPGCSGYASVLIDGAVSGSAIFSEYTNEGSLITEAAVSASTAMDFFTFPVDVTGDFNTGVAITNPSGIRDINIFVRLLNTSGDQVDTKTLTLPAGRQMSFYVSGVGQLFPGLSNFRGSLQLMADIPIPAVALRSSSRTLTTLPPVALDQSYQPATLHFPQMVVGPAGASYRSTIVLTNPGYFPVTGRIDFKLSDGNPMVIGLGSAPRSNFYDFRIPAQGSLFLESAPAEHLMTGYAVLTADHGLGGVIIFSQYDAAGKLLTEAAVPPAPLSQDFLIFAQSDGAYNTGVALANIHPQASDLSYRLRSEANPDEILQRDPASLDAGKQNAALLSGSNQLFPAFSGLGTLEVGSAFPIPAVALRLRATTMTAMPVVPIYK